MREAKNYTVSREYNTLKKRLFRNQKTEPYQQTNEKEIRHKKTPQSCVQEWWAWSSESTGLILHIHSYPDSENRHGPTLATRSSDNSPVSYFLWSRRVIYSGGEVAFAQTLVSQKEGSPSSQGRETWREVATVSGRTTNLSTADLRGKNAETALARSTHNVKSWTLSAFWRF